MLTNRLLWIAVGAIVGNSGPRLGLSEHPAVLGWEPEGLLIAWQTSAPVAEAVARAVARPDLLLVGLIGKFPLLAVGLLLPFLPLLRGFAPSLRRLKDERTAGPGWQSGWCSRPACSSRPVSG